MSACPSFRMVEISRSTGSTGGEAASEGPVDRGERDGNAAPPRKHWGADLSASVTVFLIALPLSLGIALATGAPLQAGLVAAAIGGIVGGRLGGAPLQVSGPAAGLTVVTAELIQTYGWRTTCAITVVAGLTQLLLACCRVARSALMVSPAIVHGILAGIGVTIALAQLHIVLGGGPESSAIANVKALPAQLADPHPMALSVSALTIAVLLLWPRVREWGGRPGDWPHESQPPSPPWAWPLCSLRSREWNCPGWSCRPGAAMRCPRSRKARCSDCWPPCSR